MFCVLAFGISQKIFHVHLKRMYILLLLSWNALRISIKFIWSNVSFKTAVSLLIFSSEDLPIDVNGKWKPFTMTITVNLPFYIFKYSFHIFICSSVGCVYVYKGYILSLDGSFYYYVMLFFVSYYSCSFKVYLVWYKYCYPSSFYISMWMKYLLGCKVCFPAFLTLSNSIAMVD